MNCSLCRVILVFLLASDLFAQISQKKGVVLSIGNSEYPRAPLQTPVSDAEQFGQRLLQLGFDVDSRSNLNNADLNGAISALKTRAHSHQGPIIFYYAGHAVQINGVNYLVPIDAHVTVSTDIPNQTVALDSVFQALAGLDSVPKIIILDACRSNPFATIAPNEWIKGLAAPTNARPNTLIAFSTDPGNVAFDGVGTHSPYTRAILQALDEPGLTADELFRAVRENVKINTDGVQTPWETTSLSKPFYFWDPLYVNFHIGNADDDCVVLLNGVEVTEWSNDGPAIRRGQLKVGTNPVIVKVYNQRSYTGGIPPFGHLPEGWNYTLDVTDIAGHVIQHLQDGEDRPADNGPHHGKMFTVATFDLVVDSVTGVVQVTNPNWRAWQK